MSTYLPVEPRTKVSISLLLSLKDRFIFLSKNAHVPVSTTGLQQVLLAVIIQRKSYWP